VIRKMGIEWNLRLRMAEKGLFSTSDLVPLLAERGVALSRGACQDVCVSESVSGVDFLRC
jgi:hypothetical protein